MKETVLLIIGLSLNVVSILVLVICTWCLKIYYHNHPPEENDGQVSESATAIDAKGAEHSQVKSEGVAMSDIANIAAKQESSRLEQDSFRQEVLELLKSAVATKQSPVTKFPLTSSLAQAPAAPHLILPASSSDSILAPSTEPVQVFQPAPAYYPVVNNAEVIRNPLWLLNPFLMRLQPLPTSQGTTPRMVATS